MAGEATRFQPGQSGNPAGKPKGARNKTAVAIEQLLDGEAQALIITRKAIELALAGDLTAIRLCLDRLCPPRKDRHVNFTLPKLEHAGDAVKASAALVVGRTARRHRAYPVLTGTRPIPSTRLFPQKCSNDAGFW